MARCAQILIFASTKMQSSGYRANQGVPSLLYFMMTLFQLILKWAIEEGKIVVWVYSLLQWNCMTRSKNIGELAYHNFLTGDDYIKIQYDKAKADQSGEKVKDKHIFLKSHILIGLRLDVFESFESTLF